jgi:hypothetical protein
MGAIDGCAAAAASSRSRAAGQGRGGRPALRYVLLNGKFIANGGLMPTAGIVAATLPLRSRCRYGAASLGVATQHSTAQHSVIAQHSCAVCGVVASVIPRGAVRATYPNRLR